VVPLRDREPFLFLEYGRLSADDSAFLFENKSGCFDVPAAMFAALLLQPGVTVTHEAVRLAAQQQTLLIWVGEGGARYYSTGLTRASRITSRIMRQAEIAQSDILRTEAARNVYRIMFDAQPVGLSRLDQFRGWEGARVRELYKEIANQYGITWVSKQAAPTALQQCLGMATSCLYALCEAVIHASGYHPSIGIIHSGSPVSLAYDLADTVKFKTVVPLAFQVYSLGTKSPLVDARHACRDSFRRHKLSAILFDNIQEIFDVDSREDEIT